MFAGVEPLTGQKQYRTRTFRGTKRQASSALAVLVTEVDGGVVEPKKCSVAELLDAWLEHIENVGRSPSTLHGYRRLVRQLPPGFLAQPLAKVTPKVVDDLYRFLARQTSRKPATVLRFHTLLRAAFAQAVRWGWLDRNPIERATPPRVHSIETVPPTVIDVLRVLDRAAASRNPENAIVFRIVAATGCRRGEVCALKWSDVDLDGDAARVVIRRAVLDLEGRRTVYDTKTHALRWIRIDDETARMLRAQRDSAKELAEAPASSSQRTTSCSHGPREAPSRCHRTGSVRPGAGCAGRSAWRRACTTSATSRRHCCSTRARPSPRCRPRLGHRDTSTTLKISSHLMPGADQRAEEIVGKALSRPPADEPEAS